MNTQSQLRFSESLNTSKTRSTGSAKQNEDHSKESNFHQFWKRWCIELSSSIRKFSNSAKISSEAYQTFFCGKSPSFPTLHILWASLEFSGFLIRRVDVFWRAKLPHFFSISIQAHQRQNIMDSFKWMQAAFLYLVTILNLICTYLTMMVTQSTRRSYGFKCFWMKLSDSFASTGKRSLPSLPLKNWSLTTIRLITLVPPILDGWIWSNEPVKLLLLLHDPRHTVTKRIFGSQILDTVWNTETLNKTLTLYDSKHSSLWPETFGLRDTITLRH